MIKRPDPGSVTSIFMSGLHSFAGPAGKRYLVTDADMGQYRAFHDVSSAVGEARILVGAGYLRPEADVGGSVDR